MCHYLSTDTTSTSVDIRFFATMDPTGSLSEGFAYLSVGDQSPPNVPVFQDPVLTQVSCDRDHLIDSDHILLDANLMQVFSPFRTIKQVPDFRPLLSNITLGDKRLVTLAPHEAEELLTSHPSIRAVLQKAWQEGSFKEVRQLGEFLLSRSSF